MRKIFLAALCALMSVGAWSATVEDLVAIKKSWVFIADEITANGTSGLTANNLYASGRIFTPTGNSVATNKGKSTIGGEEHLNSLRLKNVQDRLAFKVADTCTITFYTQSHGTRGLVVSKTDRTNTTDAYYASQPGNTPVWTIHLDEAGTYYLSNHDGDFFIAGFSIILPDDGSEPEKKVVRYYDTDGSLLGRDSVEEGTELSYKYSAADITMSEGQAFRGWRDADQLKVAEGTLVLADMSLYAKATDIEVAATGNYFYYDLSKNYFYQEDHELLTITNGSYYNTHGWTFGANGTISVQVSANAVVSILRCAYGNGGTITCIDGNGQQVGEVENTKGTTDGEQVAFRYTGAPTTLTFTLSNGGYIHGVKVYNVENVPVKNEAGYYVIGANDGAGLLLMLETANSGDKIFLPNGTYDFGTTTLTNIGTTISLIGQSMDGVLIVNHPLTPGMNGCETLFLKGDNVYMQDLAIRCDVAYEGSHTGGVGVAIQIKGDKSIFKQVDLQGNQDTYLSSGAVNQRSWFEDGRIEGTVDFICGGGNMWFENTLLYLNDRTNGNVILAPSTSDQTVYGYVFNNCTVDGAAGQANRWNFARGWHNSPAATWLNTTCKIAPSAQGYTYMGNGLKVRFHEYNTQMENGTAITGHNLDGLNYAAESDAIYMNSDSIYTYANVILADDNWDAAAIAAQVTADPTAVNAEAVYLVEETDGTYIAIVKGASLNTYKGKYIRQANARGGFGQAVLLPAGGETGIDQITNDLSPVTHKILRNGQLIILRDGKEYNALGAQIK